MYEYPYPPPQPVPRRCNRWRGPLAFLGAMVLVAVAVGTHVMLNRLSDEVLTIIATIGCAGAMALPGLLVALVVLVRRAESSGQRNAQPIPATPTGDVGASA
jgi:hypothetical protein